MRQGAVIADRFLLERPLGSGGMGMVFLARELGSGRPVAIKMFRSTERAELLPRFARETDALARLSHPAIVRYLEHGLHVDPRVAALGEGEPFLVMEWIEGMSLDQRLASGGIAPGDALSLGIRLASALAAVHAAGLVHRDLKPGNIMLKNGELAQAQLVDFGVARVLDAGRLTASGGQVGTVRYMAPEQIRDARSVDERADLFALGCVLFECITGCPTFDGIDTVSIMARVLFEPAAHACDLYPELPTAIDAFISRLLARDPNQRPRSAASVAEELATLREREADALAGLPAALPGRVSVLGVPLPTRSLPAGAANPHARTEQVAPFMQTFSPPPSSAAKAANPLIGRTEELRRLATWLAEGIRVCVLWGSPGVGKTTLAQALLVEHERQRPTDQRIFADVGEARALEDIVHIVAQAAGVLIRGSDTPEVALGRALAHKGRVLLVIDRVEHLSAEIAALTALWTRDAPQLSLLLTTRARARLPGARLLELTPLSTTAAKPGLPSAAAQLFLERARQVRPSLGFDAGPSEFDPSLAATAPVASSPEEVERLVRALDGIPLAIELAAARTDILGLGELADHLAGPHDERSDAMQHAISWSWQLLDESERRAFACCAVFHHGFDAQAARAVLDLPQQQTAELLQSLRDKSLLAQASTRSNAARLSMFAPLREFALGQLARSGEGAAARDRHAHYYAQFGSDEQQLGPSARLLRLESERENLLSALAHSLGGDLPGACDPASARRLCVAVEPLMIGRAGGGHYLDMLERTCALEANAADELEVARVRLVRARLFGPLGRFAEARTDLELVCRAAERRGDLALHGLALLDLGVIHHLDKELSQARVSYEAALSLLRETDDLWSQGRCLGNIGSLCHDQLDFTRAAHWYKRAIDLLERCGERRTLAHFLSSLALLEQDLGERPSAREHYLAAVALFEAIGDARLLGMTLGNFATLELETENVDGAVRLHDRALGLLMGAGDLRSEALSWARSGTALVLSGRLPEGTARIARAEHMLVGLRDPVVHEAIKLQRAFVELARAQQALEVDDAADAQNNFTRAKNRALRMGSPLVASDATRDREAAPKTANVLGAATLWEQSDDVRTSMRLLAPRLRELEALLMRDAAMHVG